ncbi:MAG: DUF3240 family protein [Methylophilaceae bacterium]|jgi:hypothetical protein|nr:DUF3240 family protein [Methylophilaceae bacterium]
MEACLLTIFGPPALEETLVDWLLEEERIHGFSTAETFGRGERQSSMTLLEQVTGRQRRIQFLVQTDVETAAYLVQHMRENYQGTGLYYMLTPVIESGRI